MGCSKSKEQVALEEENQRLKKELKASQSGNPHNSKDLQLEVKQMTEAIHLLEKVLNEKEEKIQRLENDPSREIHQRVKEMTSLIGSLETILSEKDEQIKSLKDKLNQ